MTKRNMRFAELELRKLLDANAITEGMTIRVFGSHLIAGRPPSDRASDGTPDDRVRFTRLDALRFGLSVRRHTGRWEKVPFAGSLEEMVQVVCTVMQHLVAEW